MKRKFIYIAFICFLGIYLLISLNESDDVKKEYNITANEGDRYFVGQDTCIKCHKNSRKGEKKWHLSKHALSYVSLIKPESKEILRLSGIDSDPFSSPICLKCHTTASGTEVWERDEGFLFEDGIQCESCHGPGSEYIDPKIMSNRREALKAGLIIPDKSSCITCHIEKGSHDVVLKNRKFDFKEFYKEIDHSGAKAIIPDEKKTEEKRSHHPRSKEWIDLKKKIEIKNVSKNGQQVLNTYKTPYNIAISKNGDLLYVTCETSDSLIIVSTESNKVIKEIFVQNQPHGVTLSPDESRIYVSNRGSDSITVIDSGTYKIIKNIIAGDEPHGLVTNREGTKLYVANSGSNDISVIDLKHNKEKKRLSAGRGTWDIKRSPDGKKIYVTNNLSHFVKFRTASISEVTVIGTKNSFVKDRIMINEANLVQGVDFSPDGEFSLVTLIRTKNLIPITRINRGWVLTNGIGVLWKNGDVDQLLLDEMGNYFADPTDLIISPDGKYAFVTGGGINRVAVIDIKKMKEVIKRYSKIERKNVLPNHLGVSTDFVIKRIKVGKSPRGLTVSNDSKFVYVSNGLDDTISVIDVNKLENVKTISLGGPEKTTTERYGEQVFHSANSTFGHQFSCHTCHPDGGIDAITYDLEPDGLGLNPVDNRTLKGILDTAPFKWTGKNKSLQRQCGPRLAVFFTRIDPFTSDQVIALERYICTIPRNPNRYRSKKGLSPAQLRGKKLFLRLRDNSGRVIIKNKRCDFCHSGPYHTNRKSFDVGTKSYLDTHSLFDTPHLNNIYESAPYLHDGRADTLEEIWTRFNPEDKHGVTNDMTKDQLNDLIEYIKTL